MNPLHQLVVVRLKEFIREPGALFWTFGFPLLLALGLSLAFQQGSPRKTPLLVLEGPAQDERAELLGSDPRFTVLRGSLDGLNQALSRGDAVMGIGGGADASYWYDPDHEEALSARRQVDDLLQRRAGRKDPLPIVDHEVRTLGSRYVDFLIPGLLGFNIMSSSLWSLGWNIVQTRRRKLLKRIAATPMRHSHYLLSHLLARLVFLVTEVSVLVIFAWAVFDVRVQGSLLAMGLFTLLGAMSFAGFGLLVASRTDRAETVSGLINLIMFPMMILSGVFFSHAHYPDWMQPLIKALPLTAFNDGLRAVFTGQDISALLLPACLLGGYGLLTFILALRLFKWE